MSHEVQHRYHVASFIVMLSWLRSSRKPSPLKIMIDKNPGELLVSTVTNNRRHTYEIESKTATKKAALNKKSSFTSKMDQNLNEQTIKMEHLDNICVVLKTGHFRK
jgi:hypothetical protein